MRRRLSTIREQREAGFTLIELLIVIVILGILAAIVVFAVGSATSDSKASACKADKKAAETALEAYKAKNGTYPAQATTATVFTALSTGTSTDGGPYLKSAPSSTDYNIAFGFSGTPARPTGAVFAAPGTTAATTSTSCPT